MGRPGLPKRGNNSGVADPGNNEIIGGVLGRLVVNGNQPELQAARKEEVF